MRRRPVLTLTLTLTVVLRSEMGEEGYHERFPLMALEGTTHRG